MNNLGGRKTNKLRGKNKAQLVGICKGEEVINKMVWTHKKSGLEQDGEGGV